MDAEHRDSKSSEMKEMSESEAPKALEAPAEAKKALNCTYCGHSELEQIGRSRFRCRKCQRAFRAPAEVLGHTKPSPSDASTPQPPTPATTATPLAPPQMMGADTTSTAVIIPPVSIDVAHDAAYSERRAWRRQVWLLRTSLFFAVCGVIVGLVFVIGAFRLGVIDCFWDSVNATWKDCRTPNWKWRIWPLIGVVTNTAAVFAVARRLWLLRSGPIDVPTEDGLCIAGSILFMVIAPFSFLYCSIHGCFCNDGAYCDGQYPRNDYISVDTCCTPPSQDGHVNTPPCLWQYMCYTWSELLLGAASFFCCIGIYKRNRPQEQAH